MATNLDQLYRQTVAKTEALFQRLDQEQRKAHIAHTSPDTYHYPTPIIYTTPVGNEAFIAKLSKKEAPQQVQAVAGNKLEGYAAKWNDATGNPYIDSYNDVTVAGSWVECIRYWEQERKKIGRSMLIPHLRDHKPQIGGVKYLAEDSQGVIYQSQLSDTPLAHDTWELAKDGFLGTSYGYEPTQYDFANMSSRKVRRLLKIMAHEISSVTFPANPYASAIAKSGGIPYITSLEAADQDIQRLLLSLKKQRELETSIENRRKAIDRLKYDLQTWFNGFEAELQIQQKHPIPSRQHTDLHESVAKLDDMFADFDLMLNR
jgi:HK97 family phage prohead protease